MAAPRQRTVLPLALCLTAGTFLLQSAISFVSPSDVAPYDVKSSNPLPLAPVLCGTVVVALWVLMNHLHRNRSHYFEKLQDPELLKEPSPALFLTVTGAVVMYLFYCCLHDATPTSTETSDAYYMEQQTFPMPMLMGAILVLLFMQSAGYVSKQSSTGANPKYVSLQSEIQSSMEQGKLRCKTHDAIEKPVLTCERLSGHEQYVSATASTLTSLPGISSSGRLSSKTSVSSQSVSSDDDAAHV